MADDKKPKIDLKARLGKTAVPAAAPTPAPAPVAVTPSGRPMPMPAPSRPPEALGSYGAGPGAGAGPGGLPIPAAMGSSPGVGGVGGLPIPNMGQPQYGAPQAGFDPSNPLAAAVAPQYQQRAPAPAHEPQRIEFDDLSLQQASKGGLKKGIIIGSVFAVALGVIGYAVGGAAEQSSSHAIAKAGAVDLANNATKARDQLKALADKMEAGRKQLITDRKFPDTLARDLAAINVDFDGKQLAGRRFSGFSTETTASLVDFITSVQGVNDRKQVIQSLLTTLQKPITEQLAIPVGQIKINYVVAVDKDPKGNVAGFLSHLAEPIAVSGQAVDLPAQFTFANPGGAGNTQLPNFKSGDIGAKPAAIYIVPKTFDTVCPSATGGQTAQLVIQLGNFINDLKGDQGAADPNIVSDSKAGLIERADKLVKSLGLVGG